MLCFTYLQETPSARSEDRQPLSSQSRFFLGGLAGPQTPIFHLTQRPA
jgi:hypothetical protein